MKKMATSFSGKKVWITGASRGIGKALALEFARQGAGLILSARKQADLEPVREECQALSGVEVQLAPLDLSDHEQCGQVAKQVVSDFGPVDILVNNAGISQKGEAHENLLEVDKRLIDVNFLGTIAVTRPVLRSMRALRRGQVVVITSLTGKFGTPLRSAYAASKHALHGYFDCVRAENDDHNIAVTLICPGFTSTEINKYNLLPDGSPYGKTDPAIANGLPPAVFARKALRAIAQKKKEAYIGRKEVVMVYIRRYVPSLYYWLITRVKTR